MEKIKILVVPSDRSGVSHFRSTTPHINLEKQYPDQFHIEINYKPNFDDDTWLKQFNIIHYHRTLTDYEKMSDLLTKLDNLGIVTIMDIDDYWLPNTTHPAYALVKNISLDSKILNNIKIARNVMTTTPLFANEIRKYNKNVFVVPNTIDSSDKQYVSNTEKSDKLRIAWLGGSSHLDDLKQLNGVVDQLTSDNLINKVQFVLCGFDTRGTHTTIEQNTGKQITRDIKPYESVWARYEEIFTNNYKSVSEKYKKYLLKFQKEEYDNVMGESYRRVWTKPITTYATNYNLSDISLAPLSDNLFNKVKSQLKVLEAGFHKKALIAQDFGPYQIDLINVLDKGGKFNDYGNALLVNENKNRKGWYSQIKRLIQNPEIIDVMGNNLYNTVKDKYEMKTVTELRKEIYLKLYNK